MKKYLLKIFARKQFYPGIIGVFVNPFYIARKGLLSQVKINANRLTGRLLDVGCGSKPYQELFNVDEYIGLEFDSERARMAGVADYYYDGTKFPFDDNSFDSVLCNQVLEHVFTPELFVSELNRVLKEGGEVFLTVPFVWDEHEQPYDYARYTSFGLKALFENNGFAIRRQTKICADASIIFQLINCYIYKLLPNSIYIQLVFNILFMAPISVIGVFLGKILPNNDDLFLDQLIIAEKV